MSTLLVVCTANVCRSPLGERLLAERLASRGIDVASAGVQGLVGAPMCPVSAAQLPADDPFAKAHAARQLEWDLIAQADLVLTMERAHRSAAVRLAPGSQAKVFTLREALLLASGLGDRQAGDLAGFAKQLHGMRGLIVPPAPEPQKRRLFRKPVEPEDPLTIVDGHGLDPASHLAAAAQVHELTGRFAELLVARLA